MKLFTYICYDYSGEISIDPIEGQDARFFSIYNIPNNLASTIKGIVDDFTAQLL